MSNSYVCTVDRRVLSTNYKTLRYSGNDVLYASFIDVACDEICRGDTRCCYSQTSISQVTFSK